MPEWVFGLLEVVMVLAIAIGVALIVSSFAGTRAAIGAGLLVAGLLGGVLVVSAQVPDRSKVKT